MYLILQQRVYSRKILNVAKSERWESLDQCEHFEHNVIMLLCANPTVSFSYLQDNLYCVGGDVKPCSLTHF